MSAEIGVPPQPGEDGSPQGGGPLASKIAPVHPADRGSEYLANERTFLAWIRTAVAIMSLGFVVDRRALAGSPPS